MYVTDQDLILQRNLHIPGFVFELKNLPSKLWSSFKTINNRNRDLWLQQIYQAGCADERTYAMFTEAFQVFTDLLAIIDHYEDLYRMFQKGTILVKVTIKIGKKL